MQYRRLGPTDMEVSVVGLGCWPIAGMTSPGTTDSDSLATIRACFDLGINHLDTAHAYGRAGQSESLIARAVAGRREEILMATKVGLYWDDQGNLLRDGSPEALRRHCHESLRRLGVDQVDLLYLHAPDEQVPVAESAGGLRRLMEEGKARSVGVSNFTVDELEAFASECPVAACQMLYNMLQRDIEAEVLPWCREHNVAVLAYEPLAKGLLAGKYGPDHVFAESDWRRQSPLFQGEAWQRNIELVDRLRPIAAAAGQSMAGLAVNWTIRQPGITAALCGAKRPDQIRETARAAGWQLTESEQAAVGGALAQYETAGRNDRD